MNQKAIFNYIFEAFNRQKVDYVIIHSYQDLPERFESDIDIAINVFDIKDAIKLLDDTLEGTEWKIIQYWRHENYAVDCVISNGDEFLQIDFCTHYERNGRVILSVKELLYNKKRCRNFYTPDSRVEFIYILLKKILKKNFSEGSKIQLLSLWNLMTEYEKVDTKKRLYRFLSEDRINEIIQCIEVSDYSRINLDVTYKELKRKTFKLLDCILYNIFDFRRKAERIMYPTGLFIVLLGVDGAGKTTIADLLKKRYVSAFRRISHYHSRVRVLNDISQIKKGSAPIDASNPHEKKFQPSKMISVVKFAYYFLDFLIGNVKITVERIKSTLVIIERYYYDYSIDKVRYNLNLSTSFLKFWEKFVKRPDVIFVLTGDSQVLQERKHEITIEEINTQKERLQSRFLNDKRAVFIDTTQLSADECAKQMILICNKIMRERREWN